MYEKIKKDIAQEYYVKNYPNDGQRFVAWYLRNIHTAVKQYLMSARMMPGGKDMLEKLNSGLKMSNDDFESRWSAD